MTKTKIYAIYLYQDDKGNKKKIFSSRSKEIAEDKKLSLQLSDIYNGKTLKIEEEYVNKSFNDLEDDAEILESQLGLDSGSDDILEDDPIGSSFDEKPKTVIPETTVKIIVEPRKPNPTEMVALDYLRMERSFVKELESMPTAEKLLYGGALIAGGLGLYYLATRNS